MAERLGARHVNRLVRAVLRRRPGPRRWLVLDDPILLAEVREILHSAPSLGDVLDLRRCDDFLDGVHTGRYTSGAHEEVLGGLVSLCVSQTTLR